jgi:hypothetical protein
MIYAADNPFIYIPKAQADPLSPETKFITDPADWVVLIINVLLIAVLAFSVISLIVAGIRFVVSRGDIKATQTAKTQFTYSIVAIVGAVGAITAVAVILNVIGIAAPGVSINNYLGL